MMSVVSLSEERQLLESLTSLFIPPGIAMSKDYCVLRCYFVSSFNGPLGDQLYQNVLDRSSIDFQDMYALGWHD